MKNLIRRCCILAAVVSVITSLSGCLMLEQKTASLKTDIPELAAYVELFNASQQTYRIELLYSDNPADYASLIKDNAPDIVIAENLASNSIVPAFMPLNKLIEKQKLDPAVFYPELYNLGAREGIPYVLPVSFNIPAIIYKQDSLSDAASGKIITPEQLKAEAALFNEGSTKKYPVMGFSPKWEKDFLLSTALIFGSEFAETEDGSLLWNDVSLKESIDFIRDWSENINGGWAAQEDFTLTYCYDPGYKLLNAGRIGYYYTNLRNFYTIPAEERTNLDFKWLGSSDSIPVVSEDIVFVGIPKQSGKKKTAEAFITWLFDKETQKALLESSHFKRMRGFGIAGGLSSLHSINQLIFPAHYTRLIGAVPAPESLDFPNNLPAQWPQIKYDVVLSWLQNQCSAEPGDQTLAEMLKTWTLQEKKK